jgi:hypothetical protein
MLMVSRAALLWFGLMIIPIACGGESSGVTCGETTVEANGQCVVAPSTAPTVTIGYACGPGTSVKDGYCVPDSSIGSGPTVPTMKSLGDYRTLCVGTTNRLYAEVPPGVFITSEGLLNIEGGIGWEMRVLETQNSLPSFVELRAGDNWQLQISSSLLGKPLSPGIYDNAQGLPETEPGHPGFYLQGPSSSCNIFSGQFEVLESKFEDGVDGGNPTVDSITVTFVVHCGDPAPINGCAHYSSSN